MDVDGVRVTRLLSTQSMPKPAMSGRERILATIRHEIPDRVPIAPRVWAWLMAEHGSQDLATHLRAFPEMDQMYPIEDGTLNVVDAVGQEPESGAVTVDGQIVHCAKPLSAGKGQALRVAVRPEMMRMTADSGSSGINELSGTVDSVTFLGSIVRVQVRLEKSKLFFDMFNNPHLVPPQVGQKLTVYFPREACLVV